MVVQGDRPVLLDPGGEVYTARTFSGKRYESKLLNSYGHPAPVVGGQLQEKGASARGETLQTVFTDASDTLRVNLTSAYNCAELKSLERTFVYSREGEGSLTVTDRVEFTAPQSFETALITAGTWVKKDEQTLLIADGKERLEVKIDTGGAPFELRDDVIKEHAAVQPTRLGIRLVGPVASARVTVTVRSAPE